MLTAADIQYILQNDGTDVTRLLLASCGKGKKLGEVNVPLCVKCIQAREKIKTKVPLWYDNPALVYPLGISVEQGSSQATALFKQKIIASLQLQQEGKETVTADLTGGMGIDSFFISKIASKHYYFERNSELCTATEYNFKQLGGTNIIVSNEDITQNDCAPLKDLEGKGISLIYIDPARRTQSGGKAILLQDYEPDITLLQEKMFAVSRYILVKVSPMADIKLNLRLLPKTSAIYVVAVENECKELLFLLDRKHCTEEPKIQCVNLSGRGDILESFTFTIEQEEQADAEYAVGMEKYLYEPGKAILKGGAYRLVAERFGCRKLAASTHLYTSDKIIENFPGKRFHIEEVVPFNKKGLKALAAKLPVAALTARNFPMDTNALKKLSGIKDGGNKHIFAVTIADGSRILAVTLPE